MFLASSILVSGGGSRGMAAAPPPFKTKMGEIMKLIAMTLASLSFRSSTATARDDVQRCARSRK